MEKKKKLKRYSVSCESETYAISLVDYPAIEVDWQYFKNQKPMQFKDDEKHIILGPVMIPNLPIYRRFEDEEFEVVFSKETIEKMAYEFMSKQRTKSVTIDHEEDANNISIVESWIVCSKNDKAYNYGFDVPEGTWMCAMKVNDSETWNRIKSGELNGFSIESLIQLDNYEFSKIIKEKNKEDNMLNVELDEDSLLAKIKSIIMDALGKSEDKPEEEPEIVDNAAEEVVEVAEEELKDEPTEEIVEASEDVPVDEVVEEAVEEVVATVEENAETEAEVENELQAVVDELNAKIAEMENTIEELQKENKKLGKKPSAEPVKMHSEKQDPWEIINQLRNGR